MSPSSAKQEIIDEKQGQGMDKWVMIPVGSCLHRCVCVCECLSGQMSEWGVELEGCMDVQYHRDLGLRAFAYSVFSLF